MGIGHRIARVPALLLFFIRAKPVSAGVTVSPSDGTSYSQPAGSAPNASVLLANATLRVTETEWNFSIATETPSDPGLFHIYPDTGADASTGYQRPSRKPEELGADYLIEGSTLHVWDGGSDHAAWGWKRVGAVKVARRLHGEMAALVSVDQLRIKNSSHLRVLVETSTEKWRSADTLSRQGI